MKLSSCSMPHECGTVGQYLWLICSGQVKHLLRERRVGCLHRNQGPVGNNVVDGVVVTGGPSIPKEGYLCGTHK